MPTKKSHPDEDTRAQSLFFSILLGRYEDELSAKVLFLGVVDPILVKKLIDGWKEELWLRSKMHERSCAMLGAQAKRTAGGSFDALPFLLARNLKHLAADLEFLDEFWAAYDEWVGLQRSLASARRGSDRSSQRQPSRGRAPDGRR